MNNAKIFFCLSIMIFCRIGFGQGLTEEPLLEGVVNVDYIKDVRFKIEPSDPKTVKGIEFNFSGYQIFPIDKKDLLNVLLDLSQFCENSDNCRYVSPGMVENKIISCNEENKNIPLYTWSFLHTSFLNDTFFSKYEVSEEGSQIVVHLGTPPRAVVAALTQNSGNVHSTKFESAATTWTLTPAEGNPSSTRVKVTGTMRSTSWLASMFAKTVRDLVKNTTELTLKHLEYGGQNKLSPGTCHISN